MKKTSDLLQPFIFEHAPIRGEIVRLDCAWQSVLDRHDSPEVLRNMMGELCAAAVLLAATLKLNGSLVLQIHGKAAVKLLVVECSGNLELRATAKWDGELMNGTLKDLVGDGHFVITLDPKDGQQAYQGVVALEGQSVAEILQSYMLRSEQLDTRLWLVADGRNAAGMLLQKLPDQQDQDSDAWDRANKIAATLSHIELLTLPAEQLIYRLYHQEVIRLFAARDVVFRCSCSRENVSKMLRMLGRDEINEIFSERDEVEVFCEFCNQRYVFDAVDTEVVFADAVKLSSSDVQH